MVCEYCDNEVPVGTRRCPSCGATVNAVQPSSQSSAGIVLSPNFTAQQIPESATVVVSPVTTHERKSRLAYILLGLFLGGLGIHNFYAERHNRALGQLLTTLLAGWLIIPLFAVCIWVLCDICAITTDGNGVKFS